MRSGCHEQYADFSEEALILKVSGEQFSIKCCTSHLAMIHDVTVVAWK